MAPLFATDPINPGQALSEYCEPDHITAAGLNYNCRNTPRTADGPRGAGGL